MCGDLRCVPLLGLRGYTSYAPSMVMRQFGCRQFIPLTSSLGEYHGIYGEGDQFHETTKVIKEAWRNGVEFQEKSKVGSYNEVVSGYNVWFKIKVANETRHIKKPQQLDVVSPNQLRDWVMENRKQEETIQSQKRKLLDQKAEIEKLTDQLATAKQEIEQTHAKEQHWKKRCRQLETKPCQKLCQSEDAENRQKAKIHTLEGVIKSQKAIIRRLMGQIDRFEAKVSGSTTSTVPDGDPEQ